MTGPAPRMLWKVYAALMLLLGATAALSYVRLGAFNTPISLLIAATKASLVALIFMEVAYAGPATWMWVAAGLYWLSILLALTMGDFVTRR